MLAAKFDLASILNTREPSDDVSSSSGSGLVL